jgi:hypothetical protein
LVEDLLEHFRLTEDYPPTHIHIDDKFCKILIPGQFSQSVSRFLERQGF